MPKDLYQWEKSGALAHHCPECFRPLSNPSALNTCIGIHVEPCERFHNQLFKLGSSGSCDPCNTEDKEQAKRHRKIAELMRDLKAIKEVEGPQETPLMNKAMDAGLETDDDKEASPAVKKQIKFTKKGKKIIPRPPKAVTSADIDFVNTVLHSGNAQEDDEDLERSHSEDADAKANRSYHAGTSNRREIRHEFIKKERGSCEKKGKIIIDSKEIDGYLQILDVPPLGKGSSGEEKQLHTELRDAIRGDLEQAKHERQQMMMRKGGFLRWVSTKAHKRLMGVGRNSRSKGSESASTTNSNISEDVGEADEETNDTEYETEINAASDQDDAANDLTMDGLKLADSEANSTTEPKTPTPKTAIKGNNRDDEGWSTVGKVSKVKQPQVGKLKLVSNGGLAKLASPLPKASKGPKGRGRPGFGVLQM